MSLYVDLEASASDDGQSEDSTGQSDEEEGRSIGTSPDRSSIGSQQSRPRSPLSEHDDADPEAPGTLLEESKQFRLSAVNVLLTYSRCTETKEYLRDFLLRQPSCKGVTRWIIGREPHRDGSPHLHAYLYNPSKFCVRRATAFDLPDSTGGHTIADGSRRAFWHPNIRTHTRTGPCTFDNYCKKHGDWIAEGLELFPTPLNFCKRLQDQESWEYYQASQKRCEPNWNVRLPGSLDVVGEPDPKRKKRHSIIIGPPSSGKSHWIVQAFGASRIYLVPTGDLGKAFDGYMKERLIIWDDPDPYPTKGLLCLLCNTYPQYMQIGARFRNKFLDPKSCRTIIMLCNEDAVPSYLFDDWFVERFTTYRVNRSDFNSQNN